MKKKQGQPAKNRRGAPEAVDKRRAARAFNDLLLDRGKTLDGRTEKRRKRLMEELRSGKKRTSKRDLKPVEILTHINELLDLGEPISNVKKVCSVRRTTAPKEDLVEVVSRLHQAYEFRPETYRFVGIDDDVLAEAGVRSAKPSRRRSRRAPPPD